MAGLGDDGRPGRWSKASFPAAAAKAATLAAFPAQRCTVPKLLGLTLQQADVALLRAGCAKGAVPKRRSTRVRPGRVLAQSSAPGAKRPLGTRVGLVVSGGRKR